MSKVLNSSRPKQLTLRSLSVQLHALRQRVEDLEDARDLEEAIRKNGSKPLIPWEQAKKELALELVLSAFFGFRSCLPRGSGLV